MEPTRSSDGIPHRGGIGGIQGRILIGLFYKHKCVSCVMCVSRIFHLCQPHSWSAYQREMAFGFHCLISPKWTTHKDHLIIRKHRFDIISVSDFSNDNSDKGCLLGLETAQLRFGGPINGEWRSGRSSGPKSDCVKWQLQRREGQAMQGRERIDEVIAVY